MLHPFPSRVWVWATPSLPGYMVLQGSCPRKPWHVGHVGKCSRLTLKISKNSTWWPRKLGVQFHYVPFISRHTITYGCHIMLYQCYILFFEVFRIPMNPMIYWKGHPNSPQLLRWCWFHGWCVLVHPLVGGCWFCMVLLTPNYIPGMMTLEAKKQNDGVLFWESSAITCYDMSCHGFSPCFFAIRCTLDARRVWSASFRWAADNTFPTKVTIVSSSWLVAVGQLPCLGELNLWLAYGPEKMWRVWIAESTNSI